MSDEFLPETDEEELKTPFSFKLMVVLTVIYLAWRLIQGIVWLVEWMT